MTTTETIRDIRKRCRLAMNGVASTGMRESGLNYKLNFGVSLLKIKEIASSYTPDKELAETLWQEDVRELKILATMLYPIIDFTKDRAGVWVRQIPNQEIREQICLNLFQKLPFASEIVADWTTSTDSNIRTTGYWLLARLMQAKLFTADNTDLISLAFDDVLSTDNVSLRNAALLALKHSGRRGKNEADNILSRLKHLKQSSDALEKEVFDSLKFEFDYYFEQ